jgi:hypothetical protein
VPHQDNLKPRKALELEHSVEAKIHSVPAAHTKDAVMVSKAPSPLQATT